MDPLIPRIDAFDFISPSAGTETAAIRQGLLRQEFTFTSPSKGTSTAAPVAVRCARPSDLDAIVEVQSHSPADFQIRLSAEQIERLVNNQQVLVAETTKDGIPMHAGAIFFTSSTKLTTYQHALDPEHYEPHGSHLYDFWIVVHKERATTADGTSVSTSLIQASDALAERLGKQGVIAFSRAGGARPRFYRTLDQSVGSSGETSIDEFLDARPHYKAQLLINYIIGCEVAKQGSSTETPPAKDRTNIHSLSSDELKQIRLETILRRQKIARKGRDVTNPQAGHFLSWLRAERPGIFDDKVLQCIERPTPDSDWNPLKNPSFAPLLGALFRQFCDRGSYLPVDPALGGLHTRLGARFHGIALHSRPDDKNALSSNILMSYERVDIEQLIERLTLAYHKEEHNQALLRIAR